MHNSSIDRSKVLLGHEKTVLTGYEIVISALLRKNKHDVPMGYPVLTALPDPDNQNNTAFENKHKDALSIIKNNINIHGDDNLVNKCLKKLPLLCRVVVPFSYRHSVRFFSCRVSDLLYIKKTPIIFDNKKSIGNNGSLSTDLFDFKNKSAALESINNIKTMLETADYRFVNVYADKVTNSSFGIIFSELNNIISALKQTFRFAISFYNYSALERTLIDTISISFYKMSDMLPILFNDSTENYIGIELCAFNSFEESNVKGLVENNHKYKSYMSFFNKTEGITKLDGEPGEPINCKYCSKVEDELEMFLEDTKHNMIQDQKINKKELKVFT